MAEVAEPPAVETLPTPAPTAPAPRPRTDDEPKLLPPYVVILHNDDLNTFLFVVTTLRKVFHFGLVQATTLTMRAHRDGRTPVWTGHKEHAELKADQVRSCGADPAMAHRGAMALRVTIEALPS